MYVRHTQGTAGTAGLDLNGLIGKLNPVCQRALEGAAGLCLSRTNDNVEVEHRLTKLL
jgi:type VI secretion system protein VasG